MNGSYTRTPVGRKSVGLAGVMALLLAAALLPGVYPARAAISESFTVNSPGDGGDQNPGDGYCDTSAGSGVCTLRAAMEEANASPGHVTIDFESWAGYIAPNSALPILTNPEGTTIDGKSSLVIVSGVNAGANATGFELASPGNNLRKLLIGNWQHGVLLYGAGQNVVRDCVINSNSGYGIWVWTSNDNRIQGNLIGLAATGTGPAPNNVGVYVNNSSSSNLIGTDGDASGDAAERNVISGNALQGIEITGSGTNDNVVAGNYIGTDWTGTTAVPNNVGILIDAGATGNRVGTDGDGSADDAERNIISGNTFGGVAITGDGSQENTVAGNYIGMNVTADAALPNGLGVGVGDLAIANIIGTDGDGQGDAAEGNVISGNTTNGVRIYTHFSGGNVIAGNLVGVLPGGVVPLGNGEHGIAIGSGGGNHVGGQARHEGNVISANAGDGIRIMQDAGGTANGNVIEHNYIGTDVSGTLDLGNGGCGVYLGEGATSTTVGGEEKVAGNWIAYNAGDGIWVDEGSQQGNFRANSIWANGGLGIDLAPDGVNPNDEDSGLDDAANEGQNYPVLTHADLVGGSTFIAGNLTSVAYGRFYVHFYASETCDPSNRGEGRTYLGAVQLWANENGAAGFSETFPVVVLPGWYITALATEFYEGDTSEFSRCLWVSSTYGNRLFLPVLMKNH